LRQEITSTLFSRFPFDGDVYISFKKTTTTTANELSCFKTRSERGKGRRDLDAKLKKSGFTDSSRLLDLCLQSYEKKSSFVYFKFHKYASE
jgi:hypothetical protein